MKTLVLITSNFPFGTGEPFLETEFPIISKEFERKLIISQNVSSNNIRSVGSDVTVWRYDTSTSFFGYFYIPFIFLRNFSLISDIYREEILFRRDIKQDLSFRKKTFLLKKIIKAIQLRNFIIKKLNTEQIFSDIVFYSYWLKTGTHSLAMLDYKRSIKITRVHRGDIYEETEKLAYLPMLKYAAEKMDTVFFISNHAKKYFLEKTQSENTRSLVSYLGVNGPTKENSDLTVNNTFTIVSCSNLSPIKRVDLLIKSLGIINHERVIKWIHFGDGLLRKNLEQLATERLGSKNNIKYEFAGQLSNNEILNYYSKNQIDLFLNTSLSEGIPVSIMEAQSYGIPVVATNTGGVSEVVVPGTGYLLPVDFKTEDLVAKITLFLNMSSEEIMKTRNNSFLNWENNFNAEPNYREFIKMVNSIFESSTNKS